MIQRVTKVAQSLDIFTELSATMQSVLLKESADLLVSLRAAIFFEEKKKGMDQVRTELTASPLGFIFPHFKKIAFGFFCRSFL